MSTAGQGPGQEDASAQRPWWYGGSQGLPDVEAIIGPQGMQAIGGVAEEALKLFMVLRERASAAEVAEAKEPMQATTAGSAGAWGSILGELASGAVQAVNEFAAAAEHSAAAPSGTGSPSSPSAGAEGPSPRVAPGEAAACAFCPICQAVALFRTVPMSAWQRLAGSIVAVADATGTAGQGATQHTSVVPNTSSPSPTLDPVAEFLLGLQESDPGDLPQDSTG